MTPDTLMGITQRNSRTAELQLRAAQQQMSELSEQQLVLEQDILTRLGNIAALHLEQGAVQDTHVSAALQVRQAAKDQAHQRLADAEQAVANALAEKDNLQARIDGLEQQVRETLELDPEYAQRVQALDQVQAAHREHVSGYLDLHDECAQKRPTFDVDPLYCYLRSHRYGTEHYQRNRVHRLLDNWLASKVNYAANRKNELSLIAMAQRNEAMQAEREAQILSLGTYITKRLKLARHEQGLYTLTSQLRESQAAIDSAKQHANMLQPQLAAFALNQDPQYLRARQLLTDQLKTRSIGQLVDLASQTRDEADDRIVEQLQTLHVQLKALETQKNALQQAQKTMQDRHERAKNLQRKLRIEANADSDVYFDLSTDFEQLLARYMDGDVSLGHVIDVLDKGRMIVHRSQTAARQTFISSTTTTFSFSTTTVSGNSSHTSDSF